MSYAKDKVSIETIAGKFLTVGELIKLLGKYDPATSVAFVSKEPKQLYMGVDGQGYLSAAACIRFTGHGPTEVCLYLCDSNNDD